MEFKTRVKNETDIETWETSEAYDVRSSSIETLKNKCCKFIYNESILVTRMINTILIYSVPKIR